MTDYHSLARQMINEAQDHPFFNRDAEARKLTIIDQPQGHYLLVIIGSEHYSRSHDCPLHLEVANGKILLHADHYPLRIYERLLKAGVPEADIIGPLTHKEREALRRDFLEMGKVEFWDDLPE